MITLADINAAYQKESKPERNEFLDLILPDLLKSQIFDSYEFRSAVEIILLTELRPIKRIAKLEVITGLDDYAILPLFLVIAINLIVAIKVG